jgi:serine/threonine protein kinase
MINGMPPFFKATPGDTYYKYFYENKLESYWSKLSERYNNPISNEFKDLISQMLCADADKRITVDAILNHPWLSSEESPCNFEEASEFLRETISLNESN